VDECKTLVSGGVTDGSIQIFPASGPGSYRSASVGLVLPPSAQCHADDHWWGAAPSPAVLHT